MYRLTRSVLPILKNSLKCAPKHSIILNRGFQYGRFLKAEESKNETENKNENSKNESEKKDEKPSEEVELSEKAKELINEKDKQIAELKDHYLRSLADMENLRQRTKKDIDNAKDFALQKFVKELLSTVDILEMALKAISREQIEESKVVSDFHTGVSMTKSELLKTLKNHGVEIIDPIDQAFDPNLHQALYKAPIPGKQSDTVLSVEKLGYTLNGRCIRPAQVGVVKNE